MAKDRQLSKLPELTRSVEMASGQSQLALTSAMVSASAA
jgi:hypothetical protein